MSQAGGNSILEWRNIRAVPSIHYWPAFARLARQEILSFRPTAVALELPDLLGEHFPRAISQLPRLSSIPMLTEAGETERCPVFPTDSLVEAARTAMELEIPVHLVDLSITIPAPSRDDPGLLDQAVLDSWSLEQTYEYYVEKTSTEPPDLENLRREETMAAHLQRLAGVPGARILFVCGMYHWERIRARLDGRNEVYAHANGPGLRIEPFSWSWIVNGLKILPWDVHYYETTRAETSFTVSRCIEALFRAAAELSHKKIPPFQFLRMMRYARNLATSRGGFQPTLYELGFAAQGFVDDRYTVDVLDLALAGWGGMESAPNEYPSRKDDGTSVFLSSETADAFLASLSRGNPVSIVHSPVGRSPLGELSALRLFSRLRRRKNPSKAPYGYSERWGRYRDEMLAEEELMASLERCWHEANLSDEDDVQEFSGGLLDGLELRETLRRFSENKLFVRECREERPTFSLVIVDFISPDEDELYRRNTYTYGTHKAISLCSPDEHLGPGLGRVSYGYLASFRRLIDDNRLETITEALGEELDNDRPGFEAVRDVALRFAPPGDILIVSDTPPDADFLEKWSHLKERIHYLRKSAIWNPGFEQIKTFGIYYYPNP